MNELGKKIVNLRETQNITQISLAKSVGITKSMLSKYEHGINMPKADILAAIADRLDVSMDYLMGKTKSESYNPKLLCMHITPGEKELFNKIRALDEDDLIRISERTEFLMEIKHNSKAKGQ